MTDVQGSSPEGVIEDATSAEGVQEAPTKDILKLNLHDNDYLMSFVSVGEEENADKRRKRRGAGGGHREAKSWSNPEKIRAQRESKERASSSNESSKTRGESHLGWRDNDARRKRQGGAVQLSKSLLNKELNAEKGKRKKKRKNAVRRQEEVYTDKDRAAAVNMGSRDIKQSLSMKRRQDRNLALQIPEEAEPGAMLALASREMATGDVGIALKFVAKALELSPGDVNALIARSKCYLLLGEPQKALEDAEAALKEKSKGSNNTKAMYYKAEALYHLGDFELALVYYYRGMRIRAEFDGFRLGIQKTREAIQNIIGEKSDPIPIALLTSNNVTPSSGSTGSGTPSEVETVKNASKGPTPTNDDNEQRDRHRGSINPAKQKSSSQRLLGKLEVDKKYLQQLLKNPDIKAPHQTSAKHIASHAEEAIAFLKGRQEFWRQQRATSSV